MPTTTPDSAARRRTALASAEADGTVLLAGGLKLVYRSGVEVVALKCRADWISLQNSALLETRGYITNWMMHRPLPCEVKAWCGCCRDIGIHTLSARLGKIRVDGSVDINFNESVVCSACGANSRVRFACDALDSYALPAHARVYVTEAETPLTKALRGRFENLVQSRYGKFGSSGDGFEDIQSLSFGDNAFDAILCLDVLEHVGDPLRAIREIWRVLSPGGVAVLSFPFFAGRERTIRRSYVSPSGAFEHILPPEYHPSPDGPCLVFSELSWDFIKEVRTLLGNGADLVNYWSAHHGHFGRLRFAFILHKLI